MGYTEYIAAAYGIAVAVLGALILQSVAAWRRAHKDLDRPDA